MCIALHFPSVFTRREQEVRVRNGMPRRFRASAALGQRAASTPQSFVAVHRTQSGVKDST